MQAGEIRCQVAGCDAELGRERTFFRRNSICEAHARAESVPDPNGSDALMRFCQQCTRLQRLAQFDGSRRSCRASLSKRRIRKRPGGSPRSSKRASLYARCGGRSRLDSESESESSFDWHGSSSDGMHTHQCQQQHLQQQQQQHLQQHLLQQQQQQELQWYEASDSGSLRSSNSDLMPTSGEGPSAAPNWAGLFATTQQLQRWFAAHHAAQKAAVSVAYSPAGTMAVPLPSPVPRSAFAVLSTTDLQRLAGILEQFSGPTQVPPPPPPQAPQFTHGLLLQRPLALKPAGSAAAQLDQVLADLGPAAAVLLQQLKAAGAAQEQQLELNLRQQEQQQLELKLRQQEQQQLELKLRQKEQQLQEAQTQLVQLLQSVMPGGSAGLTAQAVLPLQRQQQQQQPPQPQQQAPQPPQAQPQALQPLEPLRQQPAPGPGAAAGRPAPSLEQVLGLLLAAVQAPKTEKP